MADETPVASAPAPAPEAPSAPVAAEAAPTAAVESAAAPAPAAEPAPAAAPEAAPETAPEIAAVETKAEAKPDAAKDPASLLSEAAPAPDAKPEGEKPEDGKDAAPASEEARADAPLPTYEPFTVPEGVELEDPQVDRFIGTIGAFERDINPTGDPKVHAAVQGLIQNLADQYTEEAQQIGARVRDANAATFARAQEYWKDQFFQDPEIGGNRKDTTLKNCAQVIGRFGGNATQLAELKSALSMTGAGNHPAVIRFVNNIASFLGEGEPRAASKPEPQQQSRQERRYGNRK